MVSGPFISGGFHFFFGSCDDGSTACMIDSSL